MAARRSAAKRTYLGREERRKTLIETAAAVVERHGWQALSMISVAERAKVSRQLVYGHFSSVDELFAETMTWIFRDIYASARAAFQNAPGGLAELTTAAEAITFGMPAGRARALWQMMSATYSDSPETLRMSRRLRHLLTNMWTPVVTETLGLESSDARALIWMLHMAVWGARQLMDEGEVDRATAARLFAWLVNQVQAGRVMNPLPVTESQPKTRSKRK
jgi:AcrR family transcriptional regulator